MKDEYGSETCDFCGDFVYLEDEESGDKKCPKCGCVICGICIEFNDYRCRGCLELLIRETQEG